MTIGLLDPALFLERDPEVVVRELNSILLACYKRKVRLIPYPEYWPDLWRNLARPFEANPTMTHTARAAIQQLRRIGEQHRGEVGKVGQENLGSVWQNGFETLFNNIDGTSWTNRMAEATLRAVSTGEEVVMFTRLVDKRNLQIHRAAESTLDEVTRWVLHVQSRTAGRRQILCVHNPRNFQERWTTRFDWRLPAESDDAGYPFCPPAKWWQLATNAFETIRSKHCWVDSHLNGWARPNIKDGAGYHWDVFIRNPNLVQKIGLDQLNIGQHGLVEEQKQGRPGWIHHLPEGKAGKVDVTKRGWSCPK